MKENGAQKLFRRMTDRAYAEMADVSEDKVYDEILEDEDSILDEEKDESYYSGRISKGYGLI